MSQVKTSAGSLLLVRLNWSQSCNAAMKKQTRASSSMHNMLAATSSFIVTILMFLFFFSLTHQSLGECYIKKGKGSQSRIIEMSLTVDYLSNQLFDHICKENYLNALIGIHALTGCDTVSAFCGKGKWKAMQCSFFRKRKSISMLWR